MSMAWIRKTYGVPAKRGMRVEYTGNEAVPRLGTIKSARGQYLRILLDDATNVGSFHPTWRLRYFEWDAVALSGGEA